MQRIQDMFINMEEVAEDAYKNTELLLKTVKCIQKVNISRSSADYFDWKLASVCHINSGRLLVRVTSIL